MLLLAVMRGLSIPVTKLGLLTLPPLTLTATRFAIAVPLLLLFAVGRQRLPRRALPRVAALGIVGIGVGQVAQTFGVAGTSASVGTIISATIPVFVVLFAALRLKQAVSGRQALGLLAAFVGIALVALGNGNEDAGFRHRVCPLEVPVCRKRWHEFLRSDLSAAQSHQASEIILDLVRVAGSGDPWRHADPVLPVQPLLLAATGSIGTEPLRPQS